MTQPQDSAPPSFKRRMAAFLYEGVLLFGVVVVTALIYSPLTNQRHALKGMQGLQAAAFVVVGLYFVWFWSHGGQTLAMKTWHLRLVDRRRLPVGPWRAVSRYLLAYLWFLPALVSVHLMGMGGNGPVVTVALLTGVAAYLLLARLHPNRQFLHDVICGTQLVTQRPMSKTVLKPGVAGVQRAGAEGGDPS
ncbi:Uncharacterized membrane protein YckC, RDD family [Roseateles sp. YR242]|uniref:RDD family protein n=1 Tax=Roseateles sp. YR242 TaxID=1855305 RepID=UPI0008AC8CCA|nr:RDD family protein [Roseateles sp. YR242]SEL01651.1 Uncharacterized membrane protein YckC, RDD family [Roseateles sp. YR242]